MTTVRFEAATIIDVVRRAEKAAPKVAEATERYAGMVLDVQPRNGYVVIRTTNEIVFYREIVDILEASGERAQWRLSSSYLARVLDNFRSRSGDFIDFTDENGVVEITQARKKAKLGLMVLADYPDWFESDSTGSDRVTDLGAKIKLVEWAGAPDSAELGVRITSDALYATDKYVLARVPIHIPSLAEPVTLPLGLLNGLIPQRGETDFKVLGGQVLVMPNERTQIRGSTVGLRFPAVEKAMRFDYEQQFKVHREEFLALIKTSNSVQGKGRGANIQLFIGPNQCAAVTQEEDQHVGIRDIIDVEGADHDMHEMIFNPHFLNNAVGNAPDEMITFRYNQSKLTTILVDTSSGYQCWVTPIDPTRAKAHSHE